MQEYQFNYKEYNKKIYRSSGGGSIAVMVFVIIVLIGLAFFLTKQNIKHKKNEFYFVEINKCLTYKDASDLSIEIQSRAGAGYVFFDGSYHVLANFYLNKADAESVCENLKPDYPTCKVFSLKPSILNASRETK